MLPLLMAQSQKHMALIRPGQNVDKAVSYSIDLCVQAEAGSIY